MDIKAIQTYYRGTYYRSRIEARWARWYPSERHLEGFCVQ